MKDFAKKTAYLRGLMEGMKLDPSNPEHKLIAGIIDVLGDLSEVAEELLLAVDDLDETTEELGDSVDEIIERIEDVESELDYFDGFDDDYDDDDDEIHIGCPKCGAAIEIDDITDPSDIVCQKCGERIDLTADDEGYEEIDGKSDDEDDE